MSSQNIESVLEDALDNLSGNEVVSMWNIFAEENHEPQIYYMIELDDIQCAVDDDFNDDDTFFSVDNSGIAHSYSTLWEPNCPYDIGELVSAIIGQSDSFGNSHIDKIIHS